MSEPIHHDAIAREYRDSKKLPFRIPVEKYPLFRLLGDRGEIGAFVAGYLLNPDTITRPCEGPDSTGSAGRGAGWLPMLTRDSMPATGTLS